MSFSRTPLRWLCLSLSLSGWVLPAGAETNAVITGTATNDITLKYRAEQGEAAAQNNLGVCYQAGEGVQKDLAEAAKWFRRAAEQGDAKAQLNLGACYLTGTGVQADKAAAANWFRSAADQGDAKAQFNLGVCYRKGDGVTVDRQLAAFWFRKAAEQDLPAAQFNLGVCFVNGTGVQEDPAEAYKWFRLAGKSGDVQALAACAELSKALTPPQIAEAQERAQKWREEFARLHPSRR